jgi:hypothetical protein
LQLLDLDPGERPDKTESLFFAARQQGLEIFSGAVGLSDFC